MRSAGDRRARLHSKRMAESLSDPGFSEAFRSVNVLRANSLYLLHNPVCPGTARGKSDSDSGTAHAERGSQTLL